MTDRGLLGRREFTVASVLAALSGVMITITGCDADSPTGPSGSMPTPTPAPTPEPGPGQTPQDVMGTVSANHGHRAVITGAELLAGDAVRLDISGSASHPHTVDLTAEQVADIRDGQRVTMTSSFDAGHMHNVTFN